MQEFIHLMSMVLYDEDIPKYVKQDVIKRVNDWCMRGGSETDDYIKNQYRYLVRVKESFSK